MKSINLLGNVFTNLTVINKSEIKKNKKVTWDCLCSCGKILNVTTGSLRSGKTKSCGCYKSKITSERNFKHGFANSRAHNSWSAMKQRCYYEKHKDYKSYGGKGIKVCDEWVNSFEQFLNDMGHPKDGESLDRINPDLNYSKENCKWSTISEQSKNKSIHRKKETGIRKRKNNLFEVYLSEKYVGSSLIFEEALAIRKKAEKEIWNMEFDKV